MGIMGRYVQRKHRISTHGCWRAGQLCHKLSTGSSGPAEHDARPAAFTFALAAPCVAPARRCHLRTARLDLAGVGCTGPAPYLGADQTWQRHCRAAHSLPGWPRYGCC